MTIIIVDGDEAYVNTCDNGVKERLSQLRFSPADVTPELRHIYYVPTACLAFVAPPVADDPAVEDCVAVVA